MTFTGYIGEIRHKMAAAEKAEKVKMIEANLMTLDVLAKNVGK